MYFHDVPEIKKQERVTTACYDNKSMLAVSSNKEAVEISNTHSCSEDCLKEETEKDEGCVIEAYENAAREEVDNTYCNLCDKRVAVETLAEYLNQKTPEELLSDFDVSVYLFVGYNDFNDRTNVLKE